jgi:hypothetical protein
MENWLILQNLYNGLTSTSRAHIDAAAGGAFFSLIVSGATTLIEKRDSNRVGVNTDSKPKETVCIPWRKQICWPQNWIS